MIYGRRPNGFWGPENELGVTAMNWKEISIKVNRTAVEAVAEVLVDCGAGGVVIEDPFLVQECIDENQWDAFEFPDEFLQRDFVRVIAYFPCDHGLDKRVYTVRDRLDMLSRETLPGLIMDIGFGEVKEEDWANSWKEYYKPVRVGSRVVIRPTWEEYAPEAGDLVIELDPGMAFGTGTHPTTVMCVEFMERIIKVGETVFDIGTGSGILAITAARLGAGEVLAVDIDEVATQSALSNVLLNRVQDIVRVETGNLLDRVSGQADTVVANIVADVIIRAAPEVSRAVKKGGSFLASGIIAPREAETVAAIEDAGFRVVETTRSGDWVACLAIREE